MTKKEMLCHLDGIQEMLIRIYGECTNNYDKSKTLFGVDIAIRRVRMFKEKLEEK